MARAAPSLSNTPRPPGFYIKQELDNRGWGQRDLAYILDCHEQAVNLIVSGKRGISTDMAKALGAAFGVSPEFFLNLQRAYDLALARDPDPGISRRARLQASYPVREMIRRGWLADADAADLEIQMARFFEVTSANEIPHLPHAAKKPRYDEIPAPQLAWLFRVRQIARSITVAEYSSKKLKVSLRTLSGYLMEPGDVRHVVNVLAECGVRLVLVEALPQGKIDGACFWLDNKSPVIGMSLRYDRIDNFWFVLRHEIEHVLREDGQDDDIGIIDELDGNRASVDEPGLPNEEKLANRAAAEFCAPQEELVKFVDERNPYISERDVLGLAKRLDRHPGLIVGQIHSRTGRYDFLRRYLVKVRQFVLPEAITDGWGYVFPT